MLKQVVASFMLVIFMMQTFSNAVIVADYYLNTTVFAANCENKDKPQLHCNGHCQMVKKIDSEGKKDQSNPDRKAENKLEVISSKNFYPSVTIVSQESLQQFAVYNEGKPIHRSSAIFHPPCIG
ncbi:hypothetical protein I5907_10345 [Panacibacter sp. DH6]|uniref:Secreted protein n=1 Tax=Panacibacter microcysteis TaxID=2793269 RepID=A0A931EAB4_9BACT|nr:hypothetical protein [Panacibacter microcysteis]MBG9376636.1 hypothetical protein [Panacibacter microcysteis]